jgi:co-chaperonin GroES (HSP10)
LNFFLAFYTDWCILFSMSDTLPILPLPPRAYLKRLDSPAVASPYLIPDAAKELGTEAEVVAIPDQPFRTEWGVDLSCPVKVGQRVLVGKYSGVQRFRGEDVLIVRWDEILAVIVEPSVKPSAEDLKARGKIKYGRVDFPAAYMGGLPDDVAAAAGLPSAADLDAIADEHGIAKRTQKP